MRTFAILGAVFLLAGCKSAPKQYTYVIYAEDLRVPAKSLELDGKPMTATSPGTWTMTIDAKDHLTSMASRFAVVIPTTCGDEKRPVKNITVGITHADDPSGEDYVRKTYVKPGDPIQGTVSAGIIIDRPKRASLYADLDGAPASRIAVGATPLTPTSDKSAGVSIGACPTAGDVSVDGVVVGKIEGKVIADDAKGDAAHWPLSFLDVKGGHCYESVTWTYWDKDSANSPGAQDSKARIEAVSGARVYTREFDYFLKPAPIKLDDKSDWSSVSRIELRRCAQARPAVPAPPPKRKK